MKIVRLKLQNLASLAGEQEINFEADPLQHAGLIAITGATGAGKSTLLDAMCLALFNKIPRLKPMKVSSRMSAAKTYRLIQPSISCGEEQPMPIVSLSSSPRTRNAILPAGN